LPDRVRIAPIVRRLRADLERLVRAAQEPPSDPKHSAEKKGASPSMRAVIAEQPTGEVHVPQPITAPAEPLGAKSHPAETQEVCPICLHSTVEMSSYRGSPMCGGCVTLLRGY
jgi:hypothetical protein